MYRYTELYKRTLLSKSVGVESSAPIKIMLVSGSRLFLEGVRRILEDEGNIKVTEASSCREAVEGINEVEFDFLFIDSSTLNLDTGDILDWINKKRPNTKVILLGNKDRIDNPGVI